MLSRQCRICNLRLADELFATPTMCCLCAVVRERLNKMDHGWEFGKRFESDRERQERIKAYERRAKKMLPLFA